MRYLRLLVKPENLVETALNHSEVTAIGVNALSGILLVTALALSLEEFFTLPLIFILGLLLGPLVGFCLSFIHARATYSIGKWLGGSATFNDLYRIGAWSFLPLGFVLLLDCALLIWIDPSRLLGVSLAVVPLLVVLLLIFRGYFFCHNAMQRFSSARGAVATVMSIALFLLAVGIISFVTLLLIRHGVGEDLLSMLISC